MVKQKPEEVKWKDYADSLTTILFAILIGILMFDLLAFLSTRWFVVEWITGLIIGLKYAWILGSFIIHNQISKRIKTKIHWEEQNVRRNLEKNKK